MIRKQTLTIALFFLALIATACAAQETPQPAFDPADLKFSGERAFAIETEFVNRFPNRHSGETNNRLAAEWILNHFTDLGWDCSMDEWEIINYSRVVPLNNVVCRLPGDSPREILVTAHHDQASTTVQGADNDGSGIAILMQLAEIFAAEEERPYSLIFAATDAEEYGMIGSGRVVETHGNTENIIAGISLDNLGRDYYDGMNMELIGQYRRYGPIWLALTARESARAAGLEWDVYLRAPFDQITDQAAPVSFMDQGPVVAAGIPALGFAARVPSEFSDLHYSLWHDEDDTLDHQSAASLGQSGLIAEALIRQLSGMDDFPRESGPYLYFDDSGTKLSGAPLWAVFIGFVCLFLLGSLRAGGRSLRDAPGAWSRACPHFLSLWLPLLASIVSLYGFSVIGLMNKYYRYPATTKDPDLLQPRLPAIFVFLLLLGIFIYVGRKAAQRFAVAPPSASDVRSLALIIIALSGVYLLAVNPFSLLFFVPLLFWFLIRSRHGFGRALDILFFLLGGLVVYALIYIFGFVTLRYNFAFLWYLMYMFSTQMIGFITAAMITAVVAGGLAMLVNPARPK